MITIKELLDIIAFLLSLVLVVYGFQKGYDLVEYSIYNLYFVVVIITQILNLFTRK